MFREAHDRLGPELPGHIGNRFAVIARGESDHTFLPLGFAETQNLVRSAPDLKCPGLLKGLQLQMELLGAGFCSQIQRRYQRCPPDYRFYTNMCPIDIMQCRHFIHKNPFTSNLLVTVRLYRGCGDRILSVDYGV